ncbi:MAG: hypothetical protein ACE5G7_01220 [Candidatus Hydrothermarchaeaceae archaeon]
MADILTIIDSNLRQLAAWLGIDVNTLVLALFGLLIVFFVSLFLILFITIRSKIPTPREPPAELEGKEPVTLDYIEKTLMEFPAGKVHLEANVERLVFKLMETEPKVIEKIVEVPAEEKPPALEPVNLEEAKDLNAAGELICKKYAMDSLTIADEKYEVVLSNSKDPNGDAELAKSLAPQMGGKTRRVEVRGKPSVYLYSFRRGKTVFSMLFRGEDKDPRVLDMIPKDLEFLGKFLQPP